MAGRWLVLLTLCCGCVVGQMMTQQHFEDLHIGMTLNEVEQLVGKPWEYQPIGQGVVQGIYCERVDVGTARCERRYVLTYEQGRLVSKRQQEQRNPSKTGHLDF